MTRVQPVQAYCRNYFQKIVKTTPYLETRIGVQETKCKKFGIQIQSVKNVCILGHMNVTLMIRSGEYR